MKELLEKIVAFLPNYFLEFGQLLSGPKTFIGSKLQHSDDLFVAALVFAAITCVLLFIVFSPFVEGGDLWIKLATFFIWSCVGISLTALSIIIAWRMVGWRAPPKETFVIVIYYNAAMSLILAVVTLTTFGMWKIFIPEIYSLIMYTVQSGDINVSEKLKEIAKSYSLYGLLIPIFIGEFLLIFGYIMQYVWFGVGWGAFRRMNGLTKSRSALAFLVTLLLNLPATAVMFFIIAATTGKQG